MSKINEYLKHVTTSILNNKKGPMCVTMSKDRVNNENCVISGNSLGVIAKILCLIFKGTYWSTYSCGFNFGPVHFFNYHILAFEVLSNCLQIPLSPISEVNDWF